MVRARFELATSRLSVVRANQATLPDQVIQLIKHSLKVLCSINFKNSEKEGRKRPNFEFEFILASELGRTNQLFPYIRHILLPWRLLYLLQLLEQILKVLFVYARSPHCLFRFQKLVDRL